METKRGSRPRFRSLRQASLSRAGWCLAVLLLLAGVAPDRARAEAGPAGQPLIRNYFHQEFGAEIQNWDVVQNAQGLVYFANNAGVVEYDGHTWRLIELPSHLSVLSLALDSGTGRIYVGGSGDFGYLAPDEIGRLRFFSLLPASARQDGRFDQIFTPAVTPSGVYFQAKSNLCHYAAERLDCRPWSGPSRLAFIAGRQYVQQGRGALMEMVQGDLRPAPDGQRFVDREITVMLPSPDGDGQGLLVGTRAFDLFAQRDGVFEPFLTAASRRLVRGELLDGAVLPDGSLAFATSLGGVLIVDRKGHIIRQIDRQSGLMDNHVHGIWADRQGGLWLALQSGISRVEAVAPFSRFGEESGLEREWREILIHQDTMYVRGYKGAFTAALPSPNDAASATAAAPLRFTRVAEIEPPVWAFTTVGGRLLISSQNAIYEKRGHTFQRIATYASTPIAMYRSRRDPNRVYVGLQEGAASLRLVHGGWLDEGRIDGIHETVTSIAEDDRGSLWMVLERQRVIRVDFAAPPPPTSAALTASAGSSAAAFDVELARTPPRVRVHAYDRETLTGRTYADEFAGRPVFLSETGIFEFDAATDGFVPVREFAPLLAAGRKSFFWIAEDGRGTVWVASRKPGSVDVLRKDADGRYVADKASIISSRVWSIYLEPKGDVVWLPTPDALLRYDPSVQKHDAESSATLIRRVAVDEGSIVYGGTPDLPGASKPSAAARQLIIPFGHHSLRFDFAAPTFKEAERNEYQTHLEGFDADWSGWRREPNRSYTNLPEGRYSFHVRARDARGTIGTQASFSFTIDPPWYRSRLAYAAYGLAICALLVLFWKLHQKWAWLKLQRALERLELEKLREVDQLKSRVFADISHELRTPLTLILGPVDQLLEDAPAPEIKGKLQLIRRNADYLLRLISQLLDLAKLESGRVRLQAASTDLVEMVNSIVLPFGALAERQGVQLTCGSSGEARIEAYVDREVLEKVLNNLLLNAFKFTSRGGTVRVTIAAVPHARAGEAVSDGFVEIAVADDGIGIPHHERPRIFDRFYQGDATRTRQGIGIGLAVVKEFVELHHGAIRVDSEPGGGTTFFVRLPKGTDRFKDDEIVALPRTRPVRVPASASMNVAANTGAGAGSYGHSIATTGADVEKAGDAPVVMSSNVSDDETTVLVVEDHADMRELLREHLQTRYRVVEAKDGSEALERAVAGLPDLVLSDVMMGPMDGYWLCRELRSHEATSHIPVVLLTARAAQEDRLMGLSTGADCYMVKPFDPAELLVQVKNLLDQRRLLRHRFSGSVTLKPAEMAVTPVDAAFLSRVLSVVQDHLADPEFDVERLGREVGLSRSQLHRKLRALTNQPPTLLIRSIRLHRAAELLKQKAGSVAEIAYAVGFSSQTYFAKCFREHFGCTPKEYGQHATRPLRVETAFDVLAKEMDAPSRSATTGRHREH